MTNYLISFIFLGLSAIIVVTDDNKNSRKQIDNKGFATNKQQITEIISRIENLHGYEIEFARKTAGVDSSTKIKTIICPHDDYTYAGPVYLSVLKDLNIKTVILIGVAHKAYMFNLENTMVFETFDYWESAMGSVKISAYRDSLLKAFSPLNYTVNDSLHIVEHSLEALLPFLQYYRNDIEIIPVLIPFSDFESMNSNAEHFAEKFSNICRNNSLNWGKDFAVIISNDAVHYGDEGWSGRQYNRYGTDSEGYNLAVSHEYEIINNCLKGTVTEEKVKKFISYTTEENDFKAYKWTWCGRYSVPFGLLFSMHLNNKFNSTLNGKLVKYGTSLELDAIPVDDIGMGNTAPANPNHWVGYAGMVYY
ncbi:MAG: AmmeMemoRadiSam system protein B [Bacteroidales bacterium]|nr:AmmeMemoRadiSam system protein B [Bacteroidales bacterium]